MNLRPLAPRAAIPFGIAIVALGAATFGPVPELAAGLICVALLVVELRLTRDGGTH